MPDVAAPASPSWLPTATRAGALKYSAPTNAVVESVNSAEVTAPLVFVSNGA